MKKTIIALLALSGMAMADTAVVNVTEHLLTADITSSFITKGEANWTTLNWGNLKNSNTVAISNDLNNVADFAAPGLHGFLADGTDVGDNISFSGEVTTLKKAGDGTALAYVFDVDAEIEQQGALSLNSLSFSVTTGDTAPDCYYTVYDFSGNAGAYTVSCLQSINNSKINANETMTYDVSTQKLTAGNKILFMVREGNSTTKLTDFSFTAAYTKNVPEPTTGALSLLALAGLCIRRRK